MNEIGIVVFFKKILTTIGVTLLWLSLNATAGIMYDLAFIHDRIRMANILFYILFIVSGIAYLVFIIRLWKNQPADGTDGVNGDAGK